MTATLVFPCSTPYGRAYIKAAAKRGETVIAAASVPPRADDGFESLHLPSIYDAGFEQAFMMLVETAGIDRIYSPVTLVYGYLKDLIDRRGLAIGFNDEPPFFHAIAKTHALHARAAALAPFVAACRTGGPAASNLQIAAILNVADGVFGESYEDKIADMIAVLADLPPGDVVEIGALFGRSAAVLASALMLFGRDNATLVVDPWDSGEAVQSAVAPALQDMARATDFSTIADGFDINLLPLAARGRFNRLRMTSQEGAAIYAARTPVESIPFGTTQYQGVIALLHIDGNHDYDAVAQDSALWTPHMAPGGWIIFDDYNWAHGDGPRRVADEALKAMGPRVHRAFTAGGALFLQYTDGG